MLPKFLTGRFLLPSAISVTLVITFESFSNETAVLVVIESVCKGGEKSFDGRIIVDIGCISFRQYISPRKILLQP